jgi:hypothetical protein
MCAHKHNVIKCSELSNNLLDKDLSKQVGLSFPEVVRNLVIFKGILNG